MQDNTVNRKVNFLRNKSIRSLNDSPIRIDSYREAACWNDRVCTTVQAPQHFVFDIYIRAYPYYTPNPYSLE